MLYLAAQVDNQHTMGVAEVDDRSRDSQAGDEHFGALLDDVLDLGGQITRHGGEEIHSEGPVGPSS